MHAAPHQISRVEIDAGRAWLHILVPPLVAVAVAVGLHFLIPLFGQYAERIMLDIAIAMVAAVSLNIVNGFTGQFSIGHAAFMAVGGYTAAWVSYYFSLAWWGTPVAGGGMFGVHQMLLVGSAIIGGLVAAGLGWVVGLPSLRLRGDYLAIVTLGFGEIVRVLLQQTNPQVLANESLRMRPLFGNGDSSAIPRIDPGYVFPPGVGGSLGFTDIPKATNLFIAYLFVAITFLFAYRLKTSSYGRALLSVREDEIAAEAMGVNVTRMKVRAFMFAAFFAGIAGALYAHQPFTTLRPIDAGFARSFEYVTMVVLGGLGSITGAMLAAAIIGALNVALLDLGPYRMVIYALALILLMIFRPQGLFGVREIWDFFRKGRTK